MDNNKVVKVNVDKNQKSVLNTVYKTYDPTVKHRCPLGHIRDKNNKLWERWYMFHNGDIWQHDPETDQWKMETKDELSNYY